MKTYETIIGLEVHLQLNTKTKIFCRCANTFGQKPNTQTCPVCLGLPGSLPVLNRQVLMKGILIGLALQCEINNFVKFDRKNYYYPDLPKAYQISQYDFPIAKNGYLMINEKNKIKKIRIIRAHMEEDAGKLIHNPEDHSSLIDYNRSGTPLIEIVSAPDIRSPQEAYDYLINLKLLMQYLEVSDCDMEKGSLRCDANISLRERGCATFGSKIEIKNLNSFRAVKNALDYESKRQKKLLESGETLTQETRLWDDAGQVTLLMRSKEDAHDYRYFPEPNLVPFVTSPEVIAQVQKSLPESPWDRCHRIQNDYHLSPYDANILIQDKHLCDFFEKCTLAYPHPKKICNWITGPLKEELNARKLSVLKMNVSSGSFVSLVSNVDAGNLSHLSAKDVLRQMFQTGKAPDLIIAEQELKQISDQKTLDCLIDQVISENHKIVEQIQSGKTNALGFLVGQSMQKAQGKANPKKLTEMLKRRILNV